MNGKRENFLSYCDPEEVINFIKTRSDTNNLYTDFDTDEEDPACFRSYSNDGYPISGSNNLFEYQINPVEVVELVRWKIHKSFSQLRARLFPLNFLNFIRAKELEKRGGEERKEKGNKSDRICIALGISSARCTTSDGNMGVAWPVNHSKEQCLCVIHCDYAKSKKKSGGKKYRR